MELVFGAKFYSRSDLPVTKTPFVVEIKATVSVRQLFYQKIERLSRAVISPLFVALLAPRTIVA